MHSIKELYQIGPGPSSSHTIAPRKACLQYLANFPDSQQLKVVLYGTLALGASGHFTDVAIYEAVAPRDCEIIFKPQENRGHPLFFTITGRNEHYIFPVWEVESIGGGNIKVNGTYPESSNIYPHDSFNAIKTYCLSENISLVDYVNKYEPDINGYLPQVLKQMLTVVNDGLKKRGVLPGKLELQRVANNLFLKANSLDRSAEKTRLTIMAYAYSAAEENAAGSLVVTAPTLGASGVLPAVLKYFSENGVGKTRLYNALMCAGIFGNLVKTRATISGAVGGCQAEIGTACAMAAAAIAYLEGLNIEQIEAAAEIAIEHHLGLTCDPVGGYVMIPCIERNAVAALRAFDAVLLAKNLLDIRKNRISFDMVVETMNYTGQKISLELKETSLGGLATQIILDQ